MQAQNKAPASSAISRSKPRHKWGTAGAYLNKCFNCGIERKPNSKYKGRFDYLISGAWDFRPLTPECKGIVLSSVSDLGDAK